MDNDSYNGSLELAVPATLPEDGDMLQMTGDGPGDGPGDDGGMQHPGGAPGASQGAGAPGGAGGEGQQPHRHLLVAGIAGQLQSQFQSFLDTALADKAAVIDSAVDRLVASTNDVVGQAMAERDATNRDIESLKAMIADFQQQVTQALEGALHPELQQ